MRMRVSFVIVISNHPAHVRHYFERGEREREREGERERARTRFVRKLRWHLRNSRGHCFLIKTLHPSASLSPPLSFSLSRSRSHSLSHSLTHSLSHTHTLHHVEKETPKRRGERNTMCIMLHIIHTAFTPDAPPHFASSPCVSYRDESQSRVCWASMPAPPAPARRHATPTAARRAAVGRFCHRTSFFLPQN